MTERLRLSLTGDVMFTERLKDLNWPSRARQALLGRLRASDVRFINLEMPLTRRGVRVPKMSNIRADPAVAQDLSDPDGFAMPIVSLANNHMMDYGAGGLADTTGVLDALGIDRVGAGASAAEAFRPHVRQVGAWRVGFIGISCTVPPGAEADVDRPGIAAVRVTTSFDIDPVLLAEQPGTAPQVRTRLHPGDVNSVCGLVHQVRAEVDLLVVAVHWGVTTRMVTPFQNPIADYQPLLAHALIDAGADVIVGHHSHRLDGIEFYRERPIFYGLGNFIFAGVRPHMAREGALALLEYAMTDVRQAPRIRLAPFLLNHWGCPVPAEEEGEVQRVVAVLEQACKPFSVQVRQCGLEVQVEPVT